MFPCTSGLEKGLGKTAEVLHELINNAPHLA